MQGTAKKFAILKTVCHENGYQNTDSCIKIKPYAGPRGYAYGFFDVRKTPPIQGTRFTDFSVRSKSHLHHNGVWLGIRQFLSFPPILSVWGNSQ